MSFFTKKTWKDRLTQFPNRRKLKNINTQEETVVDVSRVEGEVGEAGDGFTEENMNGLEGRIETAFGNVETTTNGLQSNKQPKTLDTPITIGDTQYTTVETALGGLNNKTVNVDSAMSSTSENPVQNKVITSALSGKVDTEAGKGLSTEDYTTTEKNKLAGIASGAEVNVQSDWSQTNSSADDYIKNKPTLGTASIKDVPTSGNAGSSEVVLGSDTRLSDARTANGGNADTATTAGKVNHRLYGKIVVDDSQADSGVEFITVNSFNGYSDIDDLKAFRIRVTVASTDWSSTTDSDGYYRYGVSLIPRTILFEHMRPKCSLVGSDDDTLPTSAQIAAYNLVGKVTGESDGIFTTFYLYAKTKPTTDFYVEFSGICA